MLALFYQMKSKKSKVEFEDYYKDNLESNEVISKSNLSNKCRICLRKGTISIYSDIHVEENIIELLESLTNISLNEGDIYPQLFCIVCSKFIKTAVIFRKAAKHTDDLLKRLVKKEVNIFEQSGHHSYSDNDNSVCDKEAGPKWEETVVKKEQRERVKHSAKVTCHICNKVMNRSYYKQHVTMHDPDHKQYVCDICGKAFRLRCAYHNHSLRHRPDFPYKCQFCPYRGRYAELLKTHMRTHTGDYRYMCTECPARFLFKSNLNSHMLKHKEPQFKCDSCKRAFHTKLMLQRHFEADHLGIKNHVCSLCGKAFGYRNAMMKHQRHVHKREKLLFGRMPAYLQVEHAIQNTGQ